MAPSFTDEQKQLLALQKRVHAQALLEEAHALDGLQPFAVVHRHRFGASVHLLWSTVQPEESHVVKFLDALEVAYEPERGEELLVEAGIGLGDLVGTRHDLADEETPPPPQTRRPASSDSPSP